MMCTEPIASETVHDLALPGCHPEPLAHYLKALGVLRLVAAQNDGSARGYWRDDVFHLVSRLDRETLLRFFLEEYEPTPVVAPWNRGSGFHPKDNQVAIKTIRASGSARLAPYRETIVHADCALESMGSKHKEALLTLLRSTFPEPTLAWLDAVFVLTSDGPKYPPLLGTGGNDGRLDFTNNFMQRLLDCLPAETDAGPQPEAAAWLSHALFDDGRGKIMRHKPIGQFFPGCAGVNPWDFVLMIEGSLVFGAAAVKRLENGQRGGMACPFTVRPCSSGFPSGKVSEEARGEIWMPLWPQPAAIDEIENVFAEGRSTVGKRQAITGLDFARSVASLGVDRGIASFVRYGFQERNGRAYFATPLGRWKVRDRPEARLLDELDEWLGRLRSAARAKFCPANIVAALHRVEEAVFKLCRHGGAQNTGAVLGALGAAERTCWASLSFCKEHGVRPVPPLSREWIEATDNGSVEFRLAASIASVQGIRQNVEGVTAGPEWARWDDSRKPWVVWNQGNLVDNLAAVMLRRVMDARREATHGGAPTSLAGRFPAALADIASFMELLVDDARIRDVFLGLCLIDWSKADWRPPAAVAGRVPDVRYAILKLCFLPDQGRRLFGLSPSEPAPIPLAPAILHRLAGGDLSGAVRLACRRLAASGLSPRVRSATGTRRLASRMLGALLLPLSVGEEGRLRVSACRMSDEIKAA